MSTQLPLNNLDPRVPINKAVRWSAAEEDMESHPGEQWMQLGNNQRVRYLEGGFQYWSKTRGSWVSGCSVSDGLGSWRRLDMNRVPGKTLTPTSVPHGPYAPPPWPHPQAYPAPRLPSSPQAEEPSCALLKEQMCLLETELLSIQYPEFDPLETTPAEDPRVTPALQAARKFRRMRSGMGNDLKAKSAEIKRLEKALVRAESRPPQADASASATLAQQAFAAALTKAQDEAQDEAQQAFAAQEAMRASYEPLVAANKGLLAKISDWESYARVLETNLDIARAKLKEFSASGWITKLTSLRGGSAQDVLAVLVNHAIVVEERYEKALARVREASAHVQQNGAGS